jgi:multidrug efflux pump subunit AcrB
LETAQGRRLRAGAFPISIDTAHIRTLAEKAEAKASFKRLTASLSGQAQAQKDAFAGLSLAALMAIALVYMVLASQFRSLLDPLVIMFSVPLGVSGVFIALWLTNTSLSVNSFMGIIMMVGIVVSNGVLLVDFANVLRERDGLDIIPAVVRAGRTRLRPILMTTIATIVGLVPMALGIGEGSETNMPLARAVIGGLTVSTFFTLFLIPALYTLLARFEKPAPAEDQADPEEGSVEAAT